MKTQVIIEQETRKIIATSFSLGKKHDYALLDFLRYLFY
ncbi:hypothetical protein [Spiroplasma endosymbiont of Eupeodes luniger]